MARRQSAASAKVAANQQATTTTFDVIESQAILKQLTGNTGGIYRKQTLPVWIRWLHRVRTWLQNHD